VEVSSIVSSPKQFLKGILLFLKANDEHAYNFFNEKQLEGHILDSILKNQIRFRVDDDFVISGICTFEFRHATREVYIVGVVGDKPFLRDLIAIWKFEYPFYRVTFHRHGKLRSHGAISEQFILN
jgi:hypothetical protein